MAALDIAAIRFSVQGADGQITQKCLSGIVTLAKIEPFGPEAPCARRHPVEKSCARRCAYRDVLERPRVPWALELLRKITQTSRLSAIGMAHRMRSLTGTFGPTEIAVPRARIIKKDGKTTEMEEQVVTGLSAPHPRRGCFDRIDLSLRNQHAPRAPGARGLVRRFGKDTISRVWRKVKGDWGAWNARSLKDEPSASSSTVRLCGSGSTGNRTYVPLNLSQKRRRRTIRHFRAKKPQFVTRYSAFRILWRPHSP